MYNYRVSEKKESLIDALLNIQPGEDILIGYGDLPKDAERITLPSGMSGTVIERRGNLIAVGIFAGAAVTTVLYVQKDSQMIRIRPIPHQKMIGSTGETVTTPQYIRWVERIKTEAPEYLPEWEKGNGGKEMADVKTIFDRYTAGYNRFSLKAVAQLSDNQLAEDLTSAIPEIPKDYAFRIAPQIRALAGDRAKEMEAEEIKSRPPAPPAPTVPKVDFWGMVKDLKIMDFEVYLYPTEPYTVKHLIVALLKNGKMVKVGEHIYKGYDAKKATKLGSEYFKLEETPYLGKPLSERVDERMFNDLNSYEKYVKQKPTTVQMRFEIGEARGGQTPVRDKYKVYYFSEYLGNVEGINDSKAYEEAIKKFGTRKEHYKLIFIKEKPQAQKASLEDMVNEYKKIGEEMKRLGITRRAGPTADVLMTRENQLWDAIRDIYLKMLEQIPESSQIVPEGLGVLALAGRATTKAVQESPSRVNLKEMISELLRGQQVIASIQSAKTIEELQPILEGIKFLPLSEDYKKSILLRYQQKHSELMAERPFGVPVKTEPEKPKVIGALTPQQKFEVELRKKAAEKRGARAQPTLTGAVSTSRRLEEFGIKERMQPEQRQRYTIRQDGRVFANENSPVEAENIYQMLKRIYPRSAIDLLENLTHPMVHTRVLKEYNPIFGETVVSQGDAGLVIKESSRYSGYYSHRAARGY